MLYIVFWIILFLMTVTIHEVSHGAVAFLRGDTTARDEGRLTLNPLKHLDPFWTVIFPVLLFFSTGGRFAIGMAKPVPVNFLRLKNPRSDMIWVALAGPVSNIVLAAGLAVVLHHFIDSVLLLYAIYFNLGLAVFNLLPIPPLDGSKVIAGLLPASWSWPFLRFEKYGFLLILGLYLTGWLFRWILPGINLLARWMGVPGIHLV